MATEPTADSSTAPAQPADRDAADADLIYLEDESGEAQASLEPHSSAGHRSHRSSPWNQPPAGLREWLALGALVAVADLTIYRAHGLAGFAAFLVAVPLLMTLAAPRRTFSAIYWVLLAMVVVLAVKTLWYATALGVMVGLALIVAISMTLVGLRPYVLDIIAYSWQTLPAGITGILFYARSAGGLGRPLVKFNWLATILPAVAFVIFSGLFILANPNLLSAFGENLEYILSTLHHWLADFAPSPVEFVFWLAVLWAAVGLLRPLMKYPVLREPQVAPPADAEKAVPAPLYSACRNTLLTVIALFAIYLAFEFKTLWFRTYPDGFHYSGYAHEGAAWLTVALGVATLVLSIIFRGRLLRDDRLPRLRRLAWVWSAQNLILALAVYNRLTIYIGFNGMTPMRIVGLCGITTVVIGFVLVIYKIAASRSFVWLVRSQLTALAAMVFLFALLPIDYLVVRYNVERILAGDPAPSVQITEHSISAEGIAQLRPLVHCSDPIIRDGVAALLAERQLDAEAEAKRNAELGWTTFQGADWLALQKLQKDAGEWSQFNDPQRRQEALELFRDYAYQWY